MCQENGVKDITEALIGFDGIANCTISKVAGFNVTKAQLALAVAEEVPSADGKTLIKNPYKNGQILMHHYQIEKLLFMVLQNLLEQEIHLKRLVLQSRIWKMPVYTNLYKADEKQIKNIKLILVIRTDGAFM